MPDPRVHVLPSLVLINNRCNKRWTLIWFDEMNAKKCIIKNNRNFNGETGITSISRSLGILTYLILKFPGWQFILVVKRNTLSLARKNGVNNIDYVFWLFWGVAIWIPRVLSGVVFCVKSVCQCVLIFKHLHAILQNARTISTIISFFTSVSLLRF